MLLLLMMLQTDDTIRIDRIASTPTFDGTVAAAEYGGPTIKFDRRGGTVQLWLKQGEGQVYLAARIADSTYYWGDDLVIGIDMAGNGGDGPGHDDFQWYFRRILDSSIVRRGDGGKWRMPRDDPDWKLGAAREGGGWEVQSSSDAAGWSIELKLDPYFFSQAGARTPAMAFRVYDDAPHGWTPWPNPAGIKQPTEVEDRPRLWIPVALSK